MHIHVISPTGEARYWIVPEIDFARNHGFSSRDLNRLRQLTEENEDVIRSAWTEHFGG